MKRKKRKAFVPIAVLPETRDDFNFIAAKKDTNIYKVARDLAKEARQKILAQNIVNDK